MVNGITGGGGLNPSQMKAMLEKIQQSKSGMGLEDAGQASQSSSVGGNFANAMVESLGEVESTVRETDALPKDALKGDLDFHEVATRVKEAELSFNFAMQVRNKLLDAYREVMRMSV